MQVAAPRRRAVRAAARRRGRAPGRRPAPAPVNGQVTVPHSGCRAGRSVPPSSRAPGGTGRPSRPRAAGSSIVTQRALAHLDRAALGTRDGTRAPARGPARSRRSSPRRRLTAPGADEQVDVDAVRRPDHAQSRAPLPDQLAHQRHRQPGAQPAAERDRCRRRATRLAGVGEGRALVGIEGEAAHRHCAVMPPSAATTDPVMNAASSLGEEQRHARDVRDVAEPTDRVLHQRALRARGRGRRRRGRAASAPSAACRRCRGR